MAVTRQVRVEIDATSWGSKKPSSGLSAIAGTQSLDMFEVLLYVAICTAPPVAHGFELSQYWPWLRYLPALDAGPGLRLRPEWTDLDSHQKTVLSDDLGMGATMWLLAKALGLVAFAPTSYVVKRVGPPALQLRKSGKRGPAKSPDFIGIDGAGLLHVIESKGTQSTGNLEDQLDKGKPQKANLVVGAPYSVGETVVAGIYIPQASAKESALCRIVDPPAGRTKAKREKPKESVQLAIARANVAAGLHLMGLPAEANAIATGQEANTEIGAVRLQSLEESQPWPEGPPLLGIRRYTRFPTLLKGTAESIQGVRAFVGLESWLLEAFADKRGRDALDKLEGRLRERLETERRTDASRAEMLVPTGLFVGVEKLVGD